MSFTTRCPACGTMFRVVADQLKISEGWVRCGHCGDVFDATLYLEPWLAAEPAAKPPTPPPPSPAAFSAPAVPAQPPEPAPEEPEPLEPFEPCVEPEAEPEPEPVPDVEPGDAQPATDDNDETGIETLPPWPDDLAEAEQASREPEPDFHEELQRFAATQARETAPLPLPVVSGSAQAMAMAPEQDPADEITEPGFMRQARRRAFWQSPGMRAGLSLLGVLLSALLLAQWVVHERSWLAAWQPTLKPWLQRACEPLGCRLDPLRRMDAIVIDSSELVRRLGNFHSFDLVLKNTSDLTLAMPALELSLTDSSDAILARRVFRPEEWPGSPTELPPQSSLPVSFRLSIALDGSTPMAGYRALVFYP